ncbi:MAG: aminoglycoside phosphotransferase family protein, partial [Proteobacteria bacterium]|nr:aminoglycoside phosphotransferase family protein [Pseudomonadota bacterium]
MSGTGTGGSDESRLVCAVAPHFELPGEFLGAARIGSGHIHETFVARCKTSGSPARFVVQRLNGYVFRDLPALMENWVRVTSHQRARLEERGVPDAERRCLTPVPARAGGFHHVDSEGGFWRAFPYLEGTRSVNEVENPEHARRASRAFGDFALQLSDLGGPPLAETIPRFHDLAHRAAALERAAREDVRGRAAGVRDEVERAAEAVAWTQDALAAAGFAECPSRVVHNDCKINNVMFDEKSGEALCVIDLDTVMHGTLLNDFGQLVRTSTCDSPEDELRLDTMRVDPALYRAVVGGYLAGAGPLLTPLELDLLHLAGPMITLEDAVRFLTDHLEGDPYYRIHREGHNRDRARAQLQLFALLQRDRDAARALVAEVAGSGQGGRLA